MTTARLTLFDRSFLGDFGALLEDAEALRFTRFPAAPPPDFAERWLERYEAGRAAGTMAAFAILDGDDGFAGLAVAPRIDEAARTAELGYVVLGSARGRGIATEALRILSAWAFAERGLLRLELLITASNEPSKRVAERAGYVREGVLRSLWVKDGVREDTELWSRLPTDP